ncbi:MAG: hypothetical protein HRU41_10890 [Saprospiraceae bacterium]|nr:hypothetical protein [Saprospiraceae bacterium]
MNYDQLYALAPDSDTLQKARGVSYAGRKWLMIEGNEKLLWANYQTAPSLIHKVVVDLEQQKFGCTCRSRQRPCRHALGLLMLLLRQDERIRVTYDPPDWVLKWQQIQAAPPPPVVANPIPVQSQRIATKRYASMQEGIIELKQWLSNLVRQGLAVAKEQPAEFWDAFAARMVDAKLGSIGKQIRLVKGFLAEEDWHERLLALIGDLHLFAQSFQRLDSLPPNLQDELISYAGVNMKKDIVLSQKGIFDHWLIVGQTFGEEENLRYRRCWLLGEKSQQFALLLDFVFGQGNFEQQWPVGAALRAEVVFYPASRPQRALLKEFGWSQKVFEGLNGYPSFESLAKGYAQALAENPWIGYFPCLLDDVIPILEGEELMLLDQAKGFISLGKPVTASWKLLALSGGHPISIFGEWNGALFFPLTAIAEGRVVAL